MVTRAARVFSVLVLLLSLGAPAIAVEARQVVTTQNSRLFRLRPELRAECHARPVQDRLASATPPAAPSPTTPRPNGASSNPITTTLKPFNGAVAGKVVNIDGDPDIGAPPELAFFPAWMADEAQQYRTTLTDGYGQAGDEGLAALTRRRRAGGADRRPAQRHAEIRRPP